MPKIFPYPAWQYPPPQIGVVPGPSLQVLDVQTPQATLRKMYAGTGFENAGPVIPQPDIFVQFTPDISSIQIGEKIRRQSQDTTQQFVPIVSAVTPPLQAPQLDTTFTRARQNPSQDTTAGSPPPFKAIPPPEDFSIENQPATVKKRYFPAIESMSPEFPNAIPWQPIPFDVAGVPGRRIQYPQDVTASAPLFIEQWLRPECWAIMPDNPPPIRRFAQTESAFYNQRVVLSPSACWAADIQQPLKRLREVPGESYSPLGQPGVLVIAGMAWEIVYLRRKYTQDDLIQPPASMQATMPPLNHALLDLYPQKRSNLAAWQQPGDWPTIIKTVLPFNWFVGPDLVPVNRTAALRLLDWFAMPPLGPIVGPVPTPGICTDAVLYFTPPAASDQPQLMNAINTYPAAIQFNSKPYDLTNSIVTIKFTRPDGTTFTQMATIYNAPGGLAFYTTVPTDFNQPGLWGRQWIVTDTNNLPAQPVVQFVVLNPASPSLNLWDQTAIHSDWQFIDNLEPLKIINPDGTSICSDYCLRRDSGEIMLAYADDFEAPQITTRWHVWRDHLANFIPAMRGVAIDQFGSQWTISAVDNRTFRTRYVLYCVMQAGKDLK